MRRRGALQRSDLADRPGRTFTGVRRLLRPGGVLAFDIAGGFVEVPEPAPPLPGASLVSADLDAATELYRLEPGGRRRRRYTMAAIREFLEAASFELPTVQVVDFEATPEEIRAWLEIPTFNDRFGGQLTREQRAAALALAWDQRAAARPPEVVRDVFFVARAT